MQWEFVVALVLAIPLILFPAVLVWYLNLGGIYTFVKRAWQRRAISVEKSEAIEREKQGASVSGRVVTPVLLMTIPVAVYSFAVWFFLARFGWEIALVVGLVMPVILAVPAFVWYINVWGIYAIIHEGGARQKRRAELLQEAEALLLGKVPVMAVSQANASDFWEDKKPCWEMERCPPAIRDGCPAYMSRTLPCWEIEGTYCKLCMESGKANGRDTGICQMCPVYKRYGEGVPIYLTLVGNGIDTYLNSLSRAR